MRGEIRLKYSRAMKFAVQMLGQHHKVLWPIVVLNPVDVMNVLVLFKRPAKHVLSNNPMLGDIALCVGVGMVGGIKQSVSIPPSAPPLPLVAILSTFGRVMAVNVGNGMPGQMADSAPIDFGDKSRLTTATKTQTGWIRRWERCAAIVKHGARLLGARPMATNVLATFGGGSAASTKACVAHAAII